MALAVLALELGFLAAAFGWRTLIEWRRTGDTGWRLRAEGPAAATFSRIALVVALLLAVAVPVADLAGLDRWGALDRPVVAAAGLVLMVAGSVVTVWAQFAMGRSWRIGVDTSERTELVTRGPFRSVRNPIYTAMLVTVTGIALAIPNVLAGILLALALCAGDPGPSSGGALSPGDALAGVLRVPRPHRALRARRRPSNLSLAGAPLFLGADLHSRRGSAICC
jgi:protein-S-isoprenylcysteine O-methyltransferase Ste14